MASIEYRCSRFIFSWTQFWWLSHLIFIMVYNNNSNNNNNNNNNTINNNNSNSSNNDKLWYSNDSRNGGDDYSLFTFQSFWDRKTWELHGLGTPKFRHVNARVWQSLWVPGCSFLRTDLESFSEGTIKCICRSWSWGLIWFRQQRVILELATSKKMILVDGLEQLIFPYIGNNNPNWLSYFSEVLKPPARISRSQKAQAEQKFLLINPGSAPCGYGIYHLKTWSTGILLSSLFHECGMKWRVKPSLNGIFHTWGYPISGWFMMENPMKILI